LHFHEWLVVYRPAHGIARRKKVDRVCDASAALQRVFNALVANYYDTVMMLQRDNWLAVKPLASAV